MSDVDGDEIDVVSELTDEEEQEKENGSGLEEESFKMEMKGLPTLALTMEMAGQGLSLLCKTGTGLAHAYVRITLQDKGLTNIALLERYVHLRYVDVCHNKLADISCLGSLPHLLVIKAEHNQLTSAALPELKYLQIVSLAHNLITSTEPIAQPMLETLNLSSNKITVFSGLHTKNLPSLHVLDVSYNLLQSTAGINLPHLQRLYLSSNKLCQCNEIQALGQLTTLHLRDNSIASLDGFAPSLSALNYINLRGNTLKDLPELNKLKCLPLLRSLILLDTPLSEMDDYRIEVCLSLRQLERLDKTTFTDNDRADAEELNEQRRQESPDI